MLRRITGIFAFVAAAALAVACAQSDAGITTKVKSKLAADPTVKASQIDVDTKNKVVTLNGTVDSQAAKDQAILITRQTPGVADVVDNLTVATASMPAETGAGTTAGMGTSTSETTTTNTMGTTTTGTTGSYGSTGTTGTSETTGTTGSSAGSMGTSNPTGGSRMSTTPGTPLTTTPR